MISLKHSCLILILVTALELSCNEPTQFRSVDVGSTAVPQSSDAQPDTSKAEGAKPSSEVTPVESTAPASPSVEPSIPTPPTLPPKQESPPVHSPEPVVRTIEETATQKGMQGSVDIALVVDDSGSMAEEQTNLSTKLGDLVRSLKDANWQIGVITTTSVASPSGDICNLTLIKSTDADGEKKFLSAVTPGVNGSGNEEGIRQAVNALKCRETPWIRPQSTVAVLIVSDEDNCSSDGADCRDQPSQTEHFLIDYVEKDLKRVVGVNAGFYGIFAPPAEACATAKNKGVQYQRLMDYRPGGSVNYGNICENSYKSTLERISKNIAKLLVPQFTLKFSPDEGTLVILGTKSNGEAITADDYALKDNIVTFRSGSEPALGTEISISYKITQ